MNPAYLADKQRQIIAELERRGSTNSLSSFIRAAWPLIEPKNPFVPGWHIDAISEHLEAVYAGEIRNLLINIPPRHAKSTIVSVAFPAWVWTRRAQHRFIYGSHSHTLSKRDSVKTRNVVQSQWYRDTFKVDWHLADDQNEKSNFVNTQGGFRRATSVLASIIGEGGDTLVLDDPHSPRSVKSDVQRKDQLDWIGEEFFTRINDPKTVSKIIIMQRLDQRDASAMVLDKAEDDWEQLMLPAFYEPERKCVTVMGWEDPRTKQDEPLWPDRFDTDSLNKLKSNMGSKAWAGQGQQRPAPAEGNLIKRTDFRYFKCLPSDLDFLALSVDLSFDDGEKNSYAVFQLWGRRKAERYLIKQTRKQMGFNEQLAVFKAMTVETVDQQMISAKWVEKKANGAALIAVVQKEISGVIAIEPQGSKVARLEAVSPQFEANNIFVPDPTEPGNEWVGDYIEEMVTFPNALHDDQVDATSQALLKLSSGIVTDWKPVSLTQKSKWRGR